MQKLLTLLVFVCTASAAQAQELYVNSEPASNMATNSLGIRLTNKFFNMKHESGTGMRFEPEVMFGFTKRLMVHVLGYASNNMQRDVRFEGAGVYAKYRFLSNDDVHSHFRMAAYVKGSLIDNPYYPVMGEEHDHTAKPYSNEELDLEGMSSGVGGGIIATQLVHKFAVSATLGYNRFMKNMKDEIPLFFSRNVANYSLSAGYLLLPVQYKSYEQTNLNLYVELLGKSNMDQYRAGYYVDVAPAIQFIFNSTTRLDLSYRTQLFGDMARNTDRSFLVRIEHNIFNVRNR
ncbi:hypothetical protein [Chitinophaga cymbidii]|uniref:Outer membrane protein beta-barrel domain-containing protein n=1 Tax=Chitinophaga cymbidii TaxID=1096750 RepID=A0A512RE38_9BACT|nr:hypothetical protein [Chitinophaga cymbidii]GEP93959.1 hypothetical protein CCY01nite_02190 [Chitinophaga cymbidii]